LGRIEGHADAREMHEGEDMPRRFTATEKWDKDWFYQASPIAKLLFIYICEHCDQAGFWKPNLRQTSDTIGVNIEMIESAFQEIQHQFIRDGNWLWIPDFIYHQGNLPLYPQKNAHKGIIRILRQHIDGFSGQIRKLLEHYHISFEETLWDSDAIAMASGKVKYSKVSKVGKKVKLWPIPGKNCSVSGCGMPAVYRDSSGTYDNYRCSAHLPEKVKRVYC